MHPEIRLWSIKNGKLGQLSQCSFREAHRERDLEDWVEQNLSLLGHADLTVLGRQVEMPAGGRLDLLAVDQNGRLVVVEFKRQQTTRDTIAQILDYASEVQGMNFEQLCDLLNENATEISEITDFDPLMVLVAAEADEAAERIVGYLASKAQLAIEIVTFTYTKLEDGQDIGSLYSHSRYAVRR